MQVQRTSLNSENKVVVEGEKELFTLTLVTSDDKVTAVLAALEDGDLAKKGEAIVSPLLTGKKAYMKWVPDSLNQLPAKAVNKLNLSDD